MLYGKILRPPGFGAKLLSVDASRAEAMAGVTVVHDGTFIGAIVNPNLLRSQVVGCIIQGLGGGLFEEIKFENGKILNPRLSVYRVPRFSDVPEIETVLVDRKDLPSSGAGETPIIAVAPAIRNAVLAATGVPLYSLTLRLKP